MTLLTVVMILGFLVLVGAFVMRLRAGGPELPDGVAVPEGSQAVAFTQGGDWFAVVVREGAAERILVYDRLTARLRQAVDIAPAEEAAAR